MKHLLSLLALSAATGAYAQHFSSDDARQRAAEFFVSQSAAGPHRAPAKVDPVLVYTAETDGMTDFYVFNRAADANGFVIINADAASELPILGYSETSTFNIETAPDNLRWWLGQYQQNGVAKAPAKASADRHDVEPLLKTTWGQDRPYSNLVPQPSSEYKPFVTGCTATAMAQIMKYHNYPETGRGSNGYIIDYGAFKKSFSADFANTRYDWANMLDDYSGEYTDAQANAVATLMYHAGVAENSVYADQTSADDRNSGKALIENFRYSPAMLRGEREYFTDDEWASTIYNELAANRPVLYSGSTTENEGHAFVCDGYRVSDGFFHMNWGWDGESDGFFALVGSKALTPNEQGTGGAASGLGFTESQSINYNILPTESGETPVHAAVWGDFTVGADRLVGSPFTSRTVNRGSGADIPVYYRLEPYNYGILPATFFAGVILRHTATGLTYAEASPLAEYTLIGGQHGEKYYSVSDTDPAPSAYQSFHTSTAPYNGTYEIIPAYSSDGGTTWQPMRTHIGYAYPTITIVGGEDATAVELPFTLSASEVEVGKTITIAPHSDFSGTVTYTTSDPTAATVSPAGVVTGLKEGHVVITATSTATTAFLATTKDFDIYVVSHIMLDAEIAIGSKRLDVGETTSISVSGGYDGEVTYSVAPAGIVSVSSTGVVTALAEGEATITVNVAGNADYNAVTKHFEVTVSNVPPAPAEPGFCMDSYPYVGEGNIVTRSNMTLHIPLYNNSTSSVYSATFYVRMNCDVGSVKWTCGFDDSYPAGYKFDYTIDPIEEEVQHYFTSGNVYTYEFFLDENCTKPMNVPSLTYYYCPDNPGIQMLIQLIDNARNNQGGTVKLIKSLANKLLGK